MEISNNTHYANDAYLLSQQKNKAEQNTVSPAEKANKDQQSEQNAAAEAKALSTTRDSSEVTDQTSNAAELSPFLPINVTKAQHSNKSESQSNVSNYKVSAHNSQLALQAEKAIESYISVENSQYGQELVNRIELMV